MYEICGILLRDLRLASIGISLCLDTSLVITPLYLAETEREREREHIPISASNRCMWGAYFVTCHVIDPIISKCSRGPSFVAHSWGSTWSLPDHPQKCHCVYFGMFLSKSTLRHAVCNDFKLRSSNGRRFQVRLNLFESLRVQDPYMPKHRTMDNNDSV
jgi:hypothetical protein